MMSCKTINRMCGSAGGGGDHDAIGECVYVEL